MQATLTELNAEHKSLIDSIGEKLNQLKELIYERQSSPPVPEPV